VLFRSAYASYREVTVDGNESYASVIAVVDVSTGNEKVITPVAEYDTTPAWSPDGKKLALTSTRGGLTRLALINPDGSDFAPLTDGSTYDGYPSWSPDGAQLAFVRNQQIWVMTRDGGNAHQLTTGDGSTSPAWQPLDPAPSGCTLWGTSSNDLLVGTEGDDAICGLGGDDTLIGLGGNDRLFGADGNDYLAGGLGFDMLDGGPGDDTLDARDGGPDTTLGGPGIDTALVDGRIDGLSKIERPRVDHDLAVWRTTSSDAFEPTNPPERAVDGRFDDWWNSGGYPSHWVEVDLGAPVDIGRISLITPEIPNGGSLLVLGRATPNDPFRQLHLFQGPTTDMQQVAYTPKRPWRAVRYVRVAVPSVTGAPWVSLRELQVYAPTQKRKHR